MPLGDRTGPRGMGPMTGRAAGYCAGYGMPGYMNPVPGRGWFGGGRGWRHWYRATGLPGWQRTSLGYPAFGGWEDPYLAQTLGYAPTPEKEVEILKQEAEFLKTQLKDVQSRIDTLEKEKKASKEKR
jgi:hypothetical protein